MKITAEAVEGAGCWKDIDASGTNFVWVGPNSEGTGFVARRETTFGGAEWWIDDIETAKKATELAKSTWGEDEWTEGYPT